jgi:hypothetical protein
MVASLELSSKSGLEGISGEPLLQVLRHHRGVVVQGGRGAGVPKRLGHQQEWHSGAQPAGARGVAELVGTDSGQASEIAAVVEEFA